MERLLQHLQTDVSESLHELAWTLFQKRSVMSVRRALTAQTSEAVCSALDEEIKALEAKQSIAVTTHAKQKPRVLGIFTGQGAQWPAMCRELISAIPIAKEILERLDHSLSDLPSEYRPTWTLMEQLNLEGDASNVYRASFAQPLCCAVQIILVELMKNAGIEFTAVVGHSSGEIACAYAAGFITASQAIRIAHLRGIMSEKAAATSGKPGLMLAAGCTQEDAYELCGLEALQGRVCVALTSRY